MVEVRCWSDGTSRPARDPVVVEEPLEVRVDGETAFVTMRTPGRDLDLVRGLLHAEAVLEEPTDLVSVAHCDDVPDEARGNVVLVALAPRAREAAERLRRPGIVSAACGVCGRAAWEDALASGPAPGPGPALDAGLVAALPGRLRAGQSVFERTGGLHAAGLFSGDGRLLALHEDVGRHNAVDKVVGEALRFGRLPLRDTLLLVSGRAGFEIVQKARRAGVPVVCSVSAPSSLAVALAREGGQTLIGFLRDGRFNVYAGEGRFDRVRGG